MRIEHGFSRTFRGFSHDRRRLCRLRRATRAGFGRGDSPFFQERDRRGRQIARRDLRSRHGGRPGRGSGHAAAHRADLSRSRRDRRGIRGRPARRGIRLGARSDRRDQKLHLRPADLGHLDRAHAPWPAGLRHDGAAVHAGAILWRRQTREIALAHGDAPPSQWATRALRTRACGSLREATLMTTSPLLIREDADRAAYFRVENEVRLARYGGDCYAYCALAAGFIDLVIETNLKPHDVVALTPIIEGAGGVISTWDGEDAANGGRIIAAGDRAVYDEALGLLLAR